MRRERSWMRAMRMMTRRRDIGWLWRTCRQSREFFKIGKSKLDKSCISNPKSEILNWTVQFLVLLLVLLLVGCSAKKEEKKEEQERVVTVDVAPVLSSSISLKVTADAVLYPLQKEDIVPKISAPVKRFYVDRGARVRAGQVLAELENRDLAGTVAENQAA